MTDTDQDEDAQWLLAYCQMHLDDLERARLRTIATRLTAQAAEIERLREALRSLLCEIALEASYRKYDVCQITRGAVDAARAALEEQKDGST